MVAITEERLTATEALRRALGHAEKAEEWHQVAEKHGRAGQQDWERESRALSLHFTHMARMWFVAGESLRCQGEDPKRIEQLSRQLQIANDTAARLIQQADGYAKRIRELEGLLAAAR